MEEGRKVVFISYSWEDVEHQDWVLKLAGNLQSVYGIKVIIDKASLGFGSDLPHFMESSIDKADKVLVILTPEYKVKAEDRTKGVGYETTMLSQELFESSITKIKIIPILRKGNKEISSPKFLSSKVYHSMIDDDNYDYQLLDLAKAINDQSTIKLPELGPIVNLDSQEVDPFIAKANKIAAEERINKEIDQLLFSLDGKKLADEEIDNIQKIVTDKKNLYESNADLKFILESNHRDAFIIKSYGFSVSVVFENIFSNVVSNLKMKVRYFKGNISLYGGGYFLGEEPIKVKEEEYLFDLNYQKEVVWKINYRTSTADEVLTRIFGFILDKIQEEKSKKFRSK